MIQYLIDASAAWRLLRDESTFAAWDPHLQDGLVKITEPTLLEILYSAQGPDHRDQLETWLRTVFGEARFPKDGWRWAEAAQYKLTQKGQHRGPGAIDLAVCATAVHHGLTVLHADNDFVTVARVLPGFAERDIRHSL
jgi:predicted nucleic acid-binding protein